MYRELFNEVQTLKIMLISYSTGGTADNFEYKTIREGLLSNVHVKEYIPSFLSSCRSLDEFWIYIKERSSTYQGRRNYIRTEFDAVLNMLEQRFLFNSPLDDSVSNTIKNRIDYEYVQQAWQKALDRRVIDPEGAITMARTLLEATCKHIMDEAAYEYDDKSELPQLYKGVQEVLNLAPSEHSEKVFKEILSGCISVVKGLGSLRNKLSDAHGKGQRVAAPSARHAQFAVNLAGSTAEFLISSWQEQSLKLTRNRDGSKLLR